MGTVVATCGGDGLVHDEARVRVCAGVLTRTPASAWLLCVPCRHLLPDALPAHLAIALLDLEEVITRTVYCMGEWARLRSCQYSVLDAIRPTAAAVAL